MRVILLKDVRGVGNLGDTKEVSAGYASNFLIPNKLGVLATPAAVKKIEADRAKAVALSKIHEDLALKNIESLSGAQLTIKERANDEGHLFAGVHEKGLSEAIKRELKLDIPESFIKLEKPIKETGEREVLIEAFGKKVSVTVSIEKA